ncbi:spore germination protein [Bacillus paranthracis]
MSAPSIRLFVRWIRLILINISLFLPSLYVAITTFHPKLIPTNLLLVLQLREKVFLFLLL